MPAKGQRTGYTINCENCGKEIYQTKTRYNRAKHHFCSNKCQKEFQHKLLFENRKCIICGKTFEVSKKSTQKLCSIECQKIWQTKQTGEKNPKFTSIKIKCENCEEEYYVKPYKTKNGQHNFCSSECRQNWYSNIWSQQSIWKDMSRKRAVKILSEGKIPFTNSTPQQIVDKILNDMNVDFENEYSCTYYSIDNYLKQYNLMIEVMGDFWHCNPIKFPIIKQEVQLKRIPKDKAKHTYIKKIYGIEILYLWETDIVHNYDMCYKLIQQYIRNKGILENYHSFNYKINDNEVLELSTELIIPYQDMNRNDLKKYKIA